MRLLSLRVVCLLLVVLFTACKSRSKPAPVTSSGVIGVDGGTLQSASGVTLSFPAQAVDSNTTVTITATQQAAPVSNAVTQVYQFSPDGIVFAHPVSIQIPVPAGTTRASLYWSHSHPDGGMDAGFDEIGGTLDGGMIWAQVVHFSEGYVAAPSTTHTVTGSVVATYQSQSNPSIINQPQDFSQQAVNAFVWNGSAYVQYPGSGLSDGTFTIPNVPLGEYVLQAGQMLNHPGVMGGDLYFVTSNNVVDMGFAINGRPDTVAAANPSYLTFNVTSMQPWQVGDVLEVWGSDTNFWVFGLDQVDRYGNAPDAGDTAFTSNINASAFPWNPGPWLIQGSHNPPDILAVAQGVQEISDAGFAYLSFQRIGTVPPFDEISGGSTTVSVNLNQLATPNVVSFDVRQRQFAAWVQDDAGNPLVGPPGTISDGASPGIGVVGEAGGLANGPLPGASADFIGAQTSPTGPDFQTGALFYGVPTGENWGVFADFEIGFAYFYTLSCPVNPSNCPTGVAPAPPLWTGGIGIYEAVAAMAAGPVVPTLSPVQSPMVNGATLYADRSGVGLTPTFSWTAPALGTPDAYRLIVDSIYLGLNANGQYRTYHKPVATLVTPHTSITLPPGILQTGGTYVVRILSQKTSYPTPDRGPFRRGFPFSFATVASGALNP